MPFSRSRSIESSTRVATSWPTRKAPDCHSIASTSVVLPWSTCATIATLRMSSLGTSTADRLAAHARGPETGARAEARERRRDSARRAAIVSSSAAAKRRISSSSTISAGSALIVFMRCPATWQRMRCSWNSGTVISWENSPGWRRSTASHSARPTRPDGGPNSIAHISPSPRTSRTTS